MQTELNCRNFECANNKTGLCTQEQVQLIPQGGIIDQMRCVQACEREKVSGTEELFGEVYEELFDWTAPPWTEPPPEEE